MSKFQLLIFDCDGVLVDSEPLSAVAHKIVYATHGLDLSDDVMSRCVGMKQKDIITFIAKETGVLLPDEAIPQIWREVEQLMQQQLEPTFGIIDFLQADKTNRCVASSSPMERIQRSLEITTVDKQFDAGCLFSSAMVKHGKPAPDLFLHAAKQCSSDPKTCAVFEDSIYGVQGAIAAGMTAFGYIGGSHCGPDHTARLKTAGATQVFSSWVEARSFLKV